MKKLKKIFNSNILQTFLLIVVTLSILVLCIETYQDIKETYAAIFRGIDTFCLCIFFLEFAIKIILFKCNYFKNYWNLLDFVILCISLIDFSTYLITIIIEMKLKTRNELSNMSTNMSNSSNLTKIDNPNRNFNELASFHFLRLFKMIRLLRALRALRVMRTIKLLSSMRIILKTCVNSFQSLGTIFILMSLFLYNFAVIGCGLFHDLDHSRFGSLFSSMFTLFQVLTLDDWYSIYLNSSNNSMDKETSLSQKIRVEILIFYLITYLIIEYFIMLNLFIAVLVDNFQLALDGAKDDDAFKDTKSEIKSNNKNDITSKYPTEEIDEITNINEEFCLNANLNNNSNLDADKSKSNLDCDHLLNGQEIDEKLNQDENNDHIYENLQKDSNRIDSGISTKYDHLLERHFQLLAAIELNTHHMKEAYKTIEILIALEDDATNFDFV